MRGWGDTVGAEPHPDLMTGEQRTRCAAQASAVCSVEACLPNRALLDNSASPAAGGGGGEG